MPLIHEPDWWRDAVVYQIYPRSFADADGDGLGDLRGITSRVPYLRELGVDAVWLSPFYPSALADGGYDVDDYRDVDPRLGTLADFDAMVAALHEAGIRVVVDIVPNHSSNRHAWFQAALAAPQGSPERERYIFRDGLGENGELPPSDWQSVFGGPAWEPVGDGQWYFHLFATEQPDFNWDNPEVREDFLTTLRFWSDRGVDGFRIDVAHALTKDLTADPLPAWADLPDVGLVDDGSHPLWDRDATAEIYHSWREVFDSYDPPRTAVAEAWVHPDRTHRYASPRGLGQAFNFDLLRANFAAGDFQEIVDRNLAFAQQHGTSNTWVLSNHDVVRHATRYGLADVPASEPAGRDWLLRGAPADELDAERGLRRARAATMFLLALPGSTYVYQGEELGLREVWEIEDSERQDPSFYRNRDVEVGRDGCRVPLPWVADAPSYGFGPTAATHLPQPAAWAELAVDAQDGVAGSTLELYRDALGLRHELQDAEKLSWVETGNDDVLAFERPGGWLCVTNFGATPVALPEGTLLLASGPSEQGMLAGETTAWLRR